MCSVFSLGQKVGREEERAKKLLKHHLKQHMDFRTLCLGHIPRSKNTQDLGLKISRV